MPGGRQIVCDGGIKKEAVREGQPGKAWIKQVKVILILVGCLCVALGAVGVVLPILPSTPFLLLAAFCFAKSSQRLNAWFKGTKLYQKNLDSFVQGKGMTWKAKLRIMGTVTVIMAIAFIAMRRTTIGRICLAVVWVAHIIAFCFMIKTCPEEQEGAPDKQQEEEEEYAYDDR